MLNSKLPSNRTWTTSTYSIFKFRLFCGCYSWH